MPALAISIPSPPEQHDQMLRTEVAQWIRRLGRASGAGAVWFERVNKPDWHLRVIASGGADWLEREARPVLAHALEREVDGSRFIEPELDDKWTGGLRVADRLAPFHRHDTLGCLEAIAADARGELGSRSHFSLQVVEELLDGLDLHGAARLAFYRESFAWAIELGRWDRNVLDSLERTFSEQQDRLTTMIEPGDEPRRWPSAAGARIGRELTARIREWVSSAATAPRDLAVYAAHSHSNRLGVHGGREAALRYLVWRARGGQPLALA